MSKISRLKKIAMETINKQKALDLVEDETVEQLEIKVVATIGNYKDNLWTIKNANAQYSTNYGSTFTACPNLFKKESSSDILLTTGADSSFSVQNIYDIAGNVLEWTLENSSYIYDPCAHRGGSFGVTGSYNPAASRFGFSTGGSYSDGSFGFRVSLF